MNVAIIVAGGIGRRMGAARAKPFLELCGEPVVIHTLRAFEACSAVDEIILVVHERERQEAMARLSSGDLAKVARVVVGGPERQDSVWNGLRHVDRAATELVIIHDGVRPLITPDQIAAVAEEARRSGAAILALPATDTIKEVEGNRVIKTLDRHRLYLVQTPQAFRAEIIISAHERARAEGRRATDDAALVEQAGFPVSIVGGSRINFKITWPEDLVIAEFLLKRVRP
ncbi:MAG: 2-C-methyl-D-erythritol 4-phosphate cytidylyltransferase [Acidobacteria bacterium]|nr:MAG: 2-C-methyl-D-erythritol 4-phosphate cytidylyltransferase [Acidobacteriota bacterium]